MADETRVRIVGLRADKLKYVIQQMCYGGVHTVNLDPTFRSTVTKKYLKHVNNTTVPKSLHGSHGHDPGYLREHSFTTNDFRVVWSAPYANDVYNGLSSFTYNHGKKKGQQMPISHWSTEGTGAFWVDKFNNNNGHWQTFLDDIVPDIFDAFEKGLFDKKK